MLYEGTATLPQPIAPDPRRADPGPGSIEHPSWRKPAGIFMILALIAVWAVVVLALSPVIGALAWPIQAIFYAIAGVVWIMPLRPLLRWMELGRFR
jgi:hypothetical protein